MSQAVSYITTTTHTYETALTSLVNYLCAICVSVCNPCAVQCLHYGPCEPQVECSFRGTTKNTNSQILRLSLSPSLSQTHCLSLPPS